MKQEELMEAIRSESKDGRLACEKAHELARKLDVSLQEIGRLCNEMKVKITACQLGCF